MIFYFHARWQYSLLAIFSALCMATFLHAAHAATVGEDIGVDDAYVNASGTLVIAWHRTPAGSMGDEAIGILVNATATPAGFVMNGSQTHPASLATGGLTGTWEPTNGACAPGFDSYNQSATSTGGNINQLAQILDGNSGDATGTASLAPGDTIYLVLVSVGYSSPCIPSGGTYEDSMAITLSSGPPSSPRNPIVIVPGAMGSVLSRVADGEEVWPNATKMLLSGTDDYLDDAKLAPNGAQTVPLAATDIVRQELTLPFYQPLIGSLEADGYAESSTLFVAPYDWRMSVASSAQAVASVIATAATHSPDGKVDVIAHSMGGLVVKEYLAHAASASIRKLILLGVPQLGAPTAFKLLDYGDDLGMNVLGFGLNQNEAQAIAQNMPGVYDLLPSRRYVAVNGGYVEDLRSGAASILDYDRTTAMLSNPSLAAQADAWHGSLDNGQFAIASSSVYNVLGCGEDTLGTIRMYDGGTYGIDPMKGDGTVPLTSAFNLAEGYQNFFDLGDDHVGLAQGGAPLALVRAILDGATSTAIGGISPSLGDCFVPDELAISLSGPAELRIYDAAGRDVGPNDASGTIDLVIPSSSYRTIGSSTFIAVPAALAPYRVEATAVASGTITLTTASVSNTVTKKKVSYVAVKLPKPKAKATLSVATADASTSPALAVDTDADGVADAAIPPTAVLDSSSTLADVVPPVITMLGMPTSTMVGATTTIAWSATDTGSGVATTSALLNGAPIANGAVVTFGAAGTSTLVVTAIDNAGNPAQKEADIAVALAPVLPPVSTPKNTSSTFAAVADAYILRATPNQNYGKANALRVGDLGESRALVRFDGAALKTRAGTSTIVSAKLVFVIADNKKGWRFIERGRERAGTLQLSRVTSAWTENGATWNCPSGTTVVKKKRVCAGGPWSATGPVASATITNAATGTISFDVTADLKNILAGAVNDGWIVSPEAACAGGAADFFARESKRGPVLVVTYAP